MAKKQLKCVRCGWDGDENSSGCFLDGGPERRAMFSCKANSAMCDVSGVIFCAKCMEDFGDTSNPKVCPRCQIGAIKRHAFV